MKELEYLLNVQELTALYRKVPSHGNYFFTNTFWPSDRNRINKVDSDDVELIVLEAITRPGTANVRNGKARVQTPSGATKLALSLFRSFTQTPIQGDCLQALREPGSHAIQNKGRTQVREVNLEQKQRFALFREVVFSQLMTVGKVYFDNEGEILVPTINASSGAVTAPSDAVIDADFLVVDNHRGDLNSIIGTSWDNAGATILDDLEAIDEQADTENAPRPEHIICHHTNKKHLRNNTQFAAWAKESNRSVETVLRGNMIEDFGGKTWHFVGGQWEDRNGTKHKMMNADRICMYPDPSAGWLRATLGSELVPRRLGMAQNAMDALGNLTKVYGDFAYATIDHNPVQLSLFNGSNFGLNFADPNAVWNPTVWV